MIQHPVHISEEIKTLNVTSEGFLHRTYIPIKFTCDGECVNPPLTIKNIPPETKSLVLIMDDPDAPGGTWAHWLVWNIPPVERIKENSVPGVQGMNDFRKLHYGGPCPPSGTHQYFIKVYALDAMLDLAAGANKAELEKVMAPHIVAFGELIGLYKRVL